jgi:Tfp pilus assembly protein PilF
LYRALIRNPDFLTTHVLLATVYIETGDIEKARAKVEEILRINPDYSLELLRERLPFKDQAVLEGALDIMRMAGLK